MSLIASDSVIRRKSKDRSFDQAIWRPEAPRRVATFRGPSRDTSAWMTLNTTPNPAWVPFVTPAPPSYRAHGAGGGPSNVMPRSFANSASIAGSGIAVPVVRTKSWKNVSHPLGKTNPRCLAGAALTTHP
jgi:hypothetical protein